MVVEAAGIACPELAEGFILSLPKETRGRVAPSSRLASPWSACRASDSGFGRVNLRVNKSDRTPPGRVIRPIPCVVNSLALARVESDPCVEGAIRATKHVEIPETRSGHIEWPFVSLPLAQGHHLLAPASKWWRRRESNPRPERRIHQFLRAYPVFVFSPPEDP